MTLWMAIFFAGAALLRLGFMADFLAKAVTVGFMHGVAVVIFVAQLPKVLGIESGRARRSPGSVTSCAIWTERTSRPRGLPFWRWP